MEDKPLVTEQQTQLLLIIGLGGLATYLLYKDESEPESLGTPKTDEERQDTHEKIYGTRDLPPRGTGQNKESKFLTFNQDEIFKNLIATEGHFRNADSKQDIKGFLYCNVKHLADAEQHADEAISHSTVVADQETVDNYKKVRNDIRDLRHDLQKGEVPPSEGITRVRGIRRDFESFNPEFDISKCKACSIK